MSAATVVGDFFELLGVRPVAGRLLRSEETGPASDPRVVVISEWLSERLFESPSEAVGRTVFLDGEAATVIGVVGGGFRGPERRRWTDLWLPYSGLVAFNGFSLESLVGPQNVNHGYLLARIPEDIAFDAARAQLATILRELGPGPDDAPQATAPLEPVLVRGLRIPPSERGRTHATLGLFGGAAALVLLIACGNVALLLLARNVTRRTITATRRALGASPARIVREHLWESLALGLLGAGVGLLVSGWGILMFRGRNLPFMPAFGGFTFDPKLAAFAGSTAVITALIFGTGPAIVAGRFDLASAMRGMVGRDPRFMASVRRTMSIAQVALCIPLLVATSLLTRTVSNLYEVDAGIGIDDVWALGLGPVGTGAAHPGAISERYRRLASTVTQMEGVRNAAVAWITPFSGGNGGARIGLAGEENATRIAAARPVTAGWFGTLGIRFEAGGPPTDDAWRVSDPVPVVLTRSLARRVFGEAEALGAAVRVGRQGLRDGVVVGVTGELRTSRDVHRPLDGYFVPIGTEPVPKASLLVRADDLGPDLAASLRSAATSVLGRDVAGGLEPLASRRDLLFSEHHLLRRILAMTAGVALVLATVGLYGVLSFTVAGRRREFGVRRALGATTSNIRRVVFAEGAYVIVMGTSLGLLAALMLAALLESRLFGLSALDPLSYLVALGTFLLAGTAACWWPAERAVSGNPAEVMGERADGDRRPPS